MAHNFGDNGYYVYGCFMSGVFAGCATGFADCATASSGPTSARREVEGTCEAQLMSVFRLGVSGCAHSRVHFEEKLAL